MTILRFWHDAGPATRSATRRRAGLTVLATAVSAGLLITPTGPAGAAAESPAKALVKVHPDIDGDGRVDVILGAARNLAVITGKGQRLVVPAPDGTDPINNIFAVFTAAGDFNADGFDDVAAADGYYQSTAGAVWIFSGGPHGTLVGDGTVPTVRLQQGLDGMPGTATSQVFFGNSLAAGDLTGDGVVDLAIGAMFETVGGHGLAGTVTLVPGSTGGLKPAKGRVLSQNTPGVPGTPEYNDKFGASLAIGDVTGDGRLDLAVGSAGEDQDGMVQLLPGARGGPTGKGTTSATAAGLKIKAPSNSVAELGRAVAIGDLTGDGRSEVVVGAPYAQVGKPQCGAVAVLRGAATGISAARARVVSQSSAGVVGICEQNDSWGYSLAIGNLIGDKRPELVVGAPVESIGKLNGGGSYTVLRPSASGVTGTGSFAVSQNAPNVPGVAEIGDTFAMNLSLADINRDGRLDVISSADGEKVGADRVGSVAFVISTSTGHPAATTSAVSGNSFTPKLLRLGRSISSAAAR
jgi:hypothetical protein